MQQLPVFQQIPVQNRTSVMIQANQITTDATKDRLNQAGVANTFQRVVNKMNSRYSFDDNGGGYNGL